MFVKTALLLSFFLFASTSAYAEEKFTISGEVNFQYDGTIYVCLLTMEGFRDFNLPGYELSQSTCKVVEMNADLKKAEKVSFTFDNIPKGTYCVFTYQDVNMNGKVDFENYRMNEPWGSYKEGAIGLSPTWQKLKFDLQKDIDGINIDM